MKEHHEEPRLMTIAMPVNLHSSNPMTVDQVQLKNGLTITILSIPLVGSDFKKGLAMMHSYFNRVKSSFEYYSNYLASVISATLVPHFLYSFMIEALRKSS